MWVAEYLRKQHPEKFDIDPKWNESDEAKRMIASEVKALREQRYDERKLLVERDAYMALAGPMPGTFLERLFQSYGLTPSEDSPVAALFSQYMPNYLKEDIVKRIGTVERYGRQILNPMKYMFARGFDEESGIGGRTPAAPGTFEELFNLAFNGNLSTKGDNPFLNAMKQIGIHERSMSFLNPAGIYRMNTGDFDGDTMWLYSTMLAGEENQQEVKDNLKSMNDAMDAARERYAKAIQKVVNKKAPKEVINKRFGQNAVLNNKGQTIVGSIEKAQDAQSVMGLMTAGIRNIIANEDLSDPDVASAMLELVRLYDEGTSSVLNRGETVEIKNEKAKNASMAARTIGRLMQQIGQEEASGKNNIIDNLFKYRGTSSNNMLGMSNLAMFSIGRQLARRGSGATSDFGLRESLKDLVDRHYNPNTAAYDAAMMQAGFLADTETGFKFWSEKEYEDAITEHKRKIWDDATMSYDEKNSIVNSMEKSLSDFRQRGL